MYLDLMTKMVRIDDAFYNDTSYSAREKKLKKQTVRCFIGDLISSSAAVCFTAELLLKSDNLIIQNAFL